MNSGQINKIFDLIRKTKPSIRQNVRSIYLDRIGSDIIPYCIEHYLNEKEANVRNDLVRFVIQYSRTDIRAINFAKIALKDKSEKVKESGLAIFAYSADQKYIPYLKSLSDISQSHSEDIGRAINAIKAQNHHLFYPEYSQWQVTQNDTERHLKKDEFRKDVDFYIIKNAKEIVPELTNILGNLY